MRRCTPSALTPCFWFVTYHIAWNQSRSGLRVPSKIVPAVGDVWRWHLAHRNWPRPVVHASVSAQDGHRKPSGQRTRRTNSAHAASVQTIRRTPSAYGGNRSRRRDEAHSRSSLHLVTTRAKWIPYFAETAEVPETC